MAKQEMTHAEALDALRPMAALVAKFGRLQEVLEHAAAHQAEYDTKERELAQLDQLLTEKQAKFSELGTALTEAEAGYQKSVSVLHAEMESKRTQAHQAHEKAVAELADDLKDARTYHALQTAHLAETLTALERQVAETQARLDQLVALQEEARKALGVA